MKTFFLLLVAFFFIPSITQGKEPSGVQAIRDWYQKTGLMIDSSQGIYMSEWVVNKKGVEYPAIGKMMGKISFYWILDQDNVTAKLVKAVAEYDFSEFASYEEYLYDTDGNILFIFNKWRNGSADVNELRIYFKNGKPFYVTATDDKTKKVTEYSKIPEIYAPDFFLVQKNIKDLQTFFKARIF
jgi:hypothetical protein